jgi:hypothetical protein
MLCNHIHEVPTVEAFAQEPSLHVRERHDHRVDQVRLNTGYEFVCA